MKVNRVHVSAGVSDAEFAWCVAELNERKLLPPQYDAVMVVGSAAKGWCNEKSDYDIYVVAAEEWTGENRQPIPAPLDPGVVYTETTTVRDRRWEIKYWLGQQVDQMLGKVSWTNFDQDVNASHVLTEPEELFLERLASCVPLAGAAWIDERRRRLDASAFRSFVVTRSLTAMDLSMEDALGQVEAGDVESAVISTRKAFGHAVDALLESLGQFGSYAPKWRARRFRAATPVQLTFEDYWSIETMRGYRPEDPARWIEDVLRTCQRIAICVEV